MKFAYNGYDKSGKAVTGTTDSSSTTEASESLRKQGIFATEILETSDEPTRTTARQRAKGGGGDRKSVV